MPAVAVMRAQGITGGQGFQKMQFDPEERQPEAKWWMCPAAPNTAKKTQLPHGTVLAATDFTSVALGVDLQSGMYMFEAILLTSGLLQIGWCPFPGQFPYSESLGVGDFTMTIAMDGFRGTFWSVNGSEHPFAWKAGDCVSCYGDLNRGEFLFALNGKELYTGNLPTRTSLQAVTQIPLVAGEEPMLLFRPAVSLSGGEVCVMNTGRVPFFYPRDNYLPVCSAQYDERTSFTLKMLENPERPAEVAFNAVTRLQENEGARWNAFCVCAVFYLRNIAGGNNGALMVKEFMEMCRLMLPPQRYADFPSALLLTIIHSSVPASIADETAIMKSWHDSPNGPNDLLEITMVNSLVLIKSILTVQSARLAVSQQKETLLTILTSLFSGREPRVVTTFFDSLDEPYSTAPSQTGSTRMAWERHGTRQISHADNRKLVDYIAQRRLWLRTETALGTQILSLLLEDEECAPEVLKQLATVVELATQNTYLVGCDSKTILSFEVSNPQLYALHIFSAIMIILRNQREESRKAGESSGDFIERVYPPSEFACGPLWYANSAEQSATSETNNSNGTSHSTQRSNIDLRLGGSYESASRKALSRLQEMQQQQQQQQQQQGSYSTVSNRIHQPNPSATATPSSFPVKVTAPGLVSIAAGLFMHAVRQLLLAIPKNTADFRSTWERVRTGVGLNDDDDDDDEEAGSGRTSENAKFRALSSSICPMMETLTSISYLFDQKDEENISTFCELLNDIVEHYYSLYRSTTAPSSTTSSSSSNPSALACTAAFPLIPMAVVTTASELWLYLRTMSGRYPSLVASRASNVLSFFSVYRYQDVVHPQISETFFGSMSDVLDTVSRNRDAVAQVLSANATATSADPYDTTKQSAIEPVIAELARMMLDSRAWLIALNVLSRLRTESHILPPEPRDNAEDYTLIRAILATRESNANDFTSSKASGPKVHSRREQTKGDPVPTPDEVSEADAFYTSECRRALENLRTSDERIVLRVYEATVSHVNTSLSQLSERLSNEQYKDTALNVQQLKTVYAVTRKSLCFLDFLLDVVISMGIFSSATARDGDDSGSGVDSQVKDSSVNSRISEPSRELMGSLGNTVNLLLQVMLRVKPVSWDSPFQERGTSPSSGAVKAAAVGSPSGKKPPLGNKDVNVNSDFLVGREVKITSSVSREQTVINTSDATVTGLLAPTLGILRRILQHYGTKFSSNPFLRAGGVELCGHILSHALAVLEWKVWEQVDMNPGGLSALKQLRSLCNELQKQQEADLLTARDSRQKQRSHGTGKSRVRRGRALVSERDSTPYMEDDESGPLGDVEGHSFTNRPSWELSGSSVVRRQRIAPSAQPVAVGGATGESLFGPVDGEAGGAAHADPFGTGVTAGADDNVTYLLGSALAAVLDDPLSLEAESHDAHIGEEIAAALLDESDESDNSDSSVADPESLCQICVERPVNTVFLPCGHRACNVCIARYSATSHLDICFFCKQAVDEVIYMDEQGNLGDGGFSGASSMQHDHGLGAIGHSHLHDYSVNASVPNPQRSAQSIFGRFPSLLPDH